MSVIYAAFTATHINMLTYCYFIYLHTYWHYLLFCLPYIPSRSYCHSLFTVNIVCVDCCVLLCIVVIVMLTETVDKGHTAGGVPGLGTSQDPAGGGQERRDSPQPRAAQMMAGSLSACRAPPSGHCGTCRLSSFLGASGDVDLLGGWGVVSSSVQGPRVTSQTGVTTCSFHTTCLTSDVIT